jgi:hypothetical protein
MTVKERLADLGGWLSLAGFELDEDSEWWLRDTTIVVVHWNRVRLERVTIFQYSDVARLRANKPADWVTEIHCPHAQPPLDVITAVIEASTQGSR